MSHCYIPEGYVQVLDAYQTQRAIEHIKSAFQRELCAALNLKRVSAPLFVASDSGLNDNLSGKERPVSFDVPALHGAHAEVVHSLAKWKRLALLRYGFTMGNGLYTDMNAIRRDEELDNVHSIYVDQWDWEKVITREARNIDFLKLMVKAIVHAMCATEEQLQVHFPQLTGKLCREVTFVTSQQLCDMYPDLTPEQRENEFTKIHKTVFVIGIGDKLSDGKPHGTRAPDYDDWSLNGDLLFWNDVLGRALELSSMGIRVDEAAMDYQLRTAGCDDRRVLPFHKMLLSGELPLTAGGGIGQSRLCMLLMGCAHIGEVQSGIWDEETKRICAEAGVRLL